MASLMLNFIFWVAFGATSGLVAGALQEKRSPSSITILIAVGAIGGFIGGLGGMHLGTMSASYEAGSTHMFFAVCGATFLLTITHLARKKLIEIMPKD